MNNAATVAVMCPIALGTASALAPVPTRSSWRWPLVRPALSHAHRTPEQHPDPGPGGFRFADYWRLGVLLALVVAISMPVLLLAWPL